MHFLPLASLAVAFVGVTAAESQLPPQPELKYDETADWYKEHEKPVPVVANEITEIEEKQSYLVKLACPDCPYLVKEGGNKRTWQEQENALLLKFNIREDVKGLSVRLNNAPVLPLAPMPLYINAYQVAANTSQDALDSIIAERMLDPDYKWQTQYNSFPLAYSHALLKTAVPAQWILQLDVQGLQFAGDAGEPLVFPDNEHRRIVELVVQQHTKEIGTHRAFVKTLSIENVRVVPRDQLTKPLRMKCGKLAVVETSFDPNEWDEFGKLGSWSHMWGKLIGKNGQYWIDRVQDNALLFPLALMLGIVGFFVRVCYQRRQQENSVDAEYALLEEESDDLPSYADIPEIKVEAYD
ncbi:hypothetical protein E8E13_000036 [Curvularia kusanoi]|uniref:Uncharacterized protein n=1 Tax=Curvularia kusanoi TaxID=90978 RepID=A0A9P4T3J6_CURKU|nr:hypothetical protein E8E13_000036 [Curvularia kusanoi]